MKTKVKSNHRRKNIYNSFNDKSALNNKMNTSKNNAVKHNICKNNTNSGNKQESCSKQTNTFTLPVSEARASIVRLIRKHPAVIIVGETGSGKTTQIPQYVLDDVIGSVLCDSNNVSSVSSSSIVNNNDVVRQTCTMVGCTQPRRVAAVSIARYVAQQRQSSIGGEVGYAVRFDDTCTEHTRLKYMTDGILLREIQTDPLLRKYACILLDEAHERTLHGDVLFGLLKDIVRQRRQHGGKAGQLSNEFKPNNSRVENGNSITSSSNNESNRWLPELKIVVMSATLNAEQFSKFWWNAPIGIVHGRTYPVSLLHTMEPQADYVEAAISTILQIHINEDGGDVLCFLTGQEEIEDAKRILEQRIKSLPNHIPDFVVLTLYAAMPYEQQLQIFEPAPQNKRKVILATNIAETSITVEGIKYVVDCGVVKAKYYNSKSGMEALAEVDVSKAQATQRAGRAGRMTAGKCYRLYTASAFEQMRDSTIPEIRRSSLMSVVLQMKSLHIDQIMQFEFMDMPNARAVMKAEETLMLLRALDEKGHITPLGVRLTDFPVDPMAAMVLLAAKAMHVERDAVVSIALTSTENLFFTSRASKEGADRCKATYARAAGDHATLLNIYRAYRHVPKTERPNWCESNSLNYRQLFKAEDIANQLYAVLMDENKSTSDEAVLRQLIAPTLHCNVKIAGKRVRSAETINNKVHDNNNNNNYDKAELHDAESTLTETPMMSAKHKIFEYELVRRALCHGYFLHTAFFNAKLGFYQTIIGQQVVHIHPSSVLFTHRKKPALVLFNSVVRTTKRYMKDVSVIHEEWLQEAAPNFFSKS